MKTIVLLRKSTETVKKCSLQRFFEEPIFSINRGKVSAPDCPHWGQRFALPLILMHEQFMYQTPNLLQEMHEEGLLCFFPIVLRSAIYPVSRDLARMLHPQNICQCESLWMPSPRVTMSLHVNINVLICR